MNDKLMRYLKINKPTKAEIEQLKHCKNGGIFPKCAIPNEDGFRFLSIMDNLTVEECVVKEDKDYGHFVVGAPWNEIIGWAKKS